MPSRAFCSDENQGSPIILITKHFGTFPFNHGRVGGIVATDRHAPHAHHGQDMVIIQASHVGYDPENEQFGHYRRLQTSALQNSSSCGKMDAVLTKYALKYQFASDNILLQRSGDDRLITIDNALLEPRHTDDLHLNLEHLVGLKRDGEFDLAGQFSTSLAFHASNHLKTLLPDDCWTEGSGAPIGTHLGPEMFYFLKKSSADHEGHDHLEQNLLPYLAQILCSPSPLLTAAQVNTRVEFERTYRSLLDEPSYRERRLLFISGVNVDVSPREGQLFPLTKFIPWAAFVQNQKGRYLLEQEELISKLRSRSDQNPDQIELDEAIRSMMDIDEIQLHFPYTESPIA